MHPPKEEENEGKSKRKRVIQSAKPKMSSDHEVSGIEENKKFTVSGNIHKLMHDSS